MFTHHQWRRAAVGVVSAAALALTIAGCRIDTPAEADDLHVVINEAYLSGGSANAPYASKFVELYNPTKTAVDLTGWSLQYRAATTTGAFTGVIALTGTIKPDGHYLVQGASNGTTGAALPTPDATGTASFQGQNGTLALVTTATALNPGTGSLVGKAGIVDLVGYGTANTFETKAAPAGRANTAGGSLNRTAHVDTDDNSKDFSVLDAVTPVNSSGGVDPTPTPTPTPPPGQVTPIAGIQGTGASSPLVGATVTTRGVVTAAYATGGYNGLYIQTPGTGGDTDATPGASDGVFVSSKDAATQLAVGQYVEVTGVVSEQAGLTQITPAAGGWKVLDEAVEIAKPANAAFPATDAEREALEGMLVQPAGEYRIADNYDTNYYGALVLSAGTDPLVQPTEAGRPGSAEAKAASADAKARTVVLDDGASINFNSAANKSIPLPYLTPDKPVRVGAAVTFTTPVILDYRFDAWEFQPIGQLTADNAPAVQPATFANTREDAPRDVGGDLTVATFNVLNYFATTGDQLTGCTYYRDREGNPITVNSGCDARGAANAASFTRQQDKIVAAINALGADVVSLEEIENSARLGKNRDFALSALVDALNAVAGDGTWAFVPSPSPVPADEDVIRTAYIYRTATAEPVGASRILDDPAFANARRPLAQVFQPVGGLAEGSDDVVVIANHFKSKGSGSGADADQGDGQGASNASRVKQATALKVFADEVAADADTDNILLVGDFNAYGQEDPVTVLTDAGYTDLGATTGEYTYVFDGLVGSLDHVFASKGAAKIVTGTDIWNINSVEPIANEYSRYNYNATILYDTTPFRSSDHDPIVVGLDLVATPASVDVDLIGINDFHGRIDANTVKFAGTIEQLRADNPDGSVFVSAGDNIGASLFASSLAQDKPTLDVLNALGLSASAVGNHEFDQGFADLTGRVTEAAEWPYLGANVYTKGTSTPALPEYEITQVSGLDVAFVGVVTQETPTLVSPAGVADLDFGDPVDALNRVTGQLKDGNESNGEADVVVALVHDGASAGTPDGATLAQEIAAGGSFAKIVTDTDPRVAAIFTGHTHKQYAWDAPVPGVEGKTRPILQTGNYGEFVGHISLTVDTATDEVTAYTAENVARTKAADADLVDTYPRVAEVKSIVDAALAKAAEIGQQPVGSITADITTAYTGGTYGANGYVGPGPQPTTGRDDRASESTLGRLVANSLLDTLADPARGGADFGVVNPGGLRAELFHAPDGVITYAEANAVLPFVNNLWTVSLTGAQVIEMLEQQWQTDAGGNRPSRPYLALSLSDNVTYTVDTADPNATPGGHVTSVTINGTLIDPAATYRVATFSFLATGGDNFRVFSAGTAPRDSGLVDRDAWIGYLKSHPGIAPTFARSGVVVPAVPGPVQAGATTSVAVSHLDLTSLGSPRNTAVSAYLVPAGAIFDPANPGTALGSATVADGAGTVPVAVPATTPAGSYSLAVVARPSGTVVRIPLTVTAAPVPPSGVKVTGINARSQCVNGTAHVAVYAINGEKVPLDIRFITPFAEQKFTAVAAGKPSYSLFNSGQTSIGAGTATVAAYYWDGVGHYQRYDVPYLAITCG